MRASNDSGYQEAPHLGRIPADWTFGRVSDLIGNINSGVSVNGEDKLRTSSEKAVLKVSAVSYGYFDNNAYKVIAAHELPRAKCNPKADRILVSRSNTPELVGASAYIRKNYPALFLPDKLWQLEPKSGSSFSMEWLSLVLASDVVRYKLSKLATGTSNSMRNITKGELLSIPVAIPPKQEQEIIVDIMRNIDTLIEKTKDLVVAKTKLKQGLMQGLLTGKQRLPGYSKKLWLKIKASELFQSCSIKKNTGESLLAVTQDNGVIPRDHLKGRVVMPSGSTAGYKLVEPGNFVISLRSFQGGLEYSEYRGIVSPAYTVLKAKKAISHRFYKHYFKSYDFIGHLAVAVIGIRDGKQISYDDFAFLDLPYPELEEQEKIAGILDLAQQEINQLKDQLALLKTQKRGLMQKLLTGQWRLPVTDKQQTNETQQAITES